MTFTKWEEAPLTTTAWRLLFRKLAIQVFVVPCTPQRWSLCSSKEWFTLSNALLKSMTDKDVCLLAAPGSRFVVSSSTSSRSWVSQDLPLLKPCWLSVRMLLSSKWCITALTMMCSRSLHWHNTGERYYRPVVGRVVLLSFLVDRCDVCISPVSWNWAWRQGGLKKKSQCRCNQSLLQAPSAHVVVLPSGPQALYGFRFCSSPLLLPLAQRSQCPP